MMHGTSHPFSAGKPLACLGLYIFLFLAGDLLSSLVFDALFSVVSLPIRDLYGIIRAVGNLLLTGCLFWWCTVKVLHLRMQDFRIAPTCRHRTVWIAILLPASLLLFYALIGTVTVTPLPFAAALSAAAYSLATALKAGVLEEMLFRGYAMGLLERRWNLPIAIFLPSFLFSLAHIPSMNHVTPAGLFLLVVSGTFVGTMFSLLAYQGHSVGNSILVHTMWNFLLATDIVHITAADAVWGEPLLTILLPSHSVLLTGAGFGAEASLPAILAYAAVCILLLVWPDRP